MASAPIWSSSQWSLGKPMVLFQIHWIFKSRGDTLTPPPSDFTTNPRNQADFSIINVPIFKRFGRNSVVLKCGRCKGESPATPKNGSWLPKLAKIPLLLHMIQFTVVTRNLLQIQWINEDRRTILTSPPSDLTQNPRNQPGFPLDIILSFNRFERNSIVLKCDHRLCESPATPKNSRWLPKNSDRVDFQHMIQFTVVTRKTYGSVTYPLKKQGS